LKVLRDSREGGRKLAEPRLSTARMSRFAWISLERCSCSA